MENITTNIDKPLLRITAVIGYFFLLSPFIITKYKGLEDTRIKYIIMTSFILFMFAANSLLIMYI